LPQPSQVELLKGKVVAAMPNENFFVNLSRNTRKDFFEKEHLLRAHLFSYSAMQIQSNVF